MDTRAEMAERHGRGLAELAELGLALARDVQARALAAPDDAAAEGLTLAFHRLARSVRQTYALESRLERDARQAGHEARVERNRDTLRRVQAKRGPIRAALAPLIWSEAEGDEDRAETLFDALDSRLMADDLICEDFAEAPLAACIETIRADLGLAIAALAANAAENGEAAGGDPVPQVVVWESSA